jgi:hypothetical protein
MPARSLNRLLSSASEQILPDIALVGPGNEGGSPDNYLPDKIGNYNDILKRGQ